MPHSGHYIPKN